MAESVRDRINRYIEDALAAERNFEDALHAFGKAGVQPDVKGLLVKAGDKARTQHQRLTRLLESRGGSPSEAKSVLAHMLAFSPLTAQVGHSAGEINTQHLIVTYGAAGAETAMYEALAEAADQAHEKEVLELARKLQSEEKDDATQVWPLLGPSARDAYSREVASGRKPMEILRAYVEDAIAAEKTFETQLTAFSKQGEFAAAQEAFSEHAKETRGQYERLTERLKGMGGTPSTVKSVVAHLFGAAPMAAQIGQEPSERMTQNLMIANAVENAEVAMYEVLAEVSAAANDHETERLAREIQKQEKATAEKVWKLIGPSARRSIQNLTVAKAS